MTPTGADGDLAALRAAAYDVLRHEPDHRDAHLRLYEIEQMLGTPSAAVAHLRAALRSSPVVGTPAPDRLRLLALTRIGPWEANVPLELVIDESKVTLTRLYLDGSEDREAILSHVPPYDVLMNSIAESDDAIPALTLAASVTQHLDGPCINPPFDVLQLSRDRVAKRFLSSEHIQAPLARRLGRDELLEREVDGALVVRPVGSQAGIALERIASTDELRAYLRRYIAADYYVSPFVDYRSADGFYRKYRIMFVDHTPIACHLAISPRWMIHYYNAPMREHAWMRDEEAAFINDLGSVFAGPLAEALDEIAAAIPIEYFGIDCAIADGRLLLFEADAAMLVHGTDPTDIYPYKRVAYDAIKTALTTLLEGSLHGSVSGR
jgi:hypothetical protein